MTLSSITEPTPKTLSAETQSFRSQVGHISRHSGAYFAGTLFSVALGYAFKVYLARELGPEALGLYALGMTLVAFVGVFNGLGLGQAALRFVPKFSASGDFARLHALLWRAPVILLAVNVVLGSALLVFGGWIATRFYHSPSLSAYLPWFAGIMLFGVMSSFYGKVLGGFKNVGQRTLISNFVGTPLSMLLAVLLLLKGTGLRGYLSAQIVSSAVICVLLLMVVRRATPADARLLAHGAGGLGREVWAYSGTTLGITFLEFVMGQVDKIALGFYRGARSVGIYAVAYAMVVYVPLVLSSVNQIFSPTISDLHARGDHALLERLFQSLTKWVIGLTWPLAVVMVVFAKPLMGIFGTDFQIGWPVLIVGTLGQLVNCGVGSVGYLLLMSGHERRLARVQAVMAAIMVALSFSLIPVWGVLGAAVAAAITNVGVNAWNLLEVRRTLGYTPYNRSYLRLVPAAMATVVAVSICRWNVEVFGHNWLAILCTGILAYLIFAAGVLLSGLSTDDRLIAAAIWSRVRGVLSTTVSGWQS